MNNHSKTKWDKVIDMKDNQINYSDIPKTDADFWKDAKIALPEAKTAIEIEIDQDIALWVKNFKNRNLAINEILRSYYTTITELKRF
jgi:uncharacterized protein (DUF4415 family)